MVAWIPLSQPELSALLVLRFALWREDLFSIVQRTALRIIAHE